MPNFSIALTGLQADSVALNTIGNIILPTSTRMPSRHRPQRFRTFFTRTLGVRERAVRFRLA